MALVQKVWTKKRILRSHRNKQDSLVPQSLLLSSVKHSTYIDIETYRPEVRDSTWYLLPVDLEFIATGTGVLGTGGGGPSYLQYLGCLERLQGPKTKGRMRVISTHSLEDSDICVFGSGYGAPSVSGEANAVRLGDRHCGGIFRQGLGSHTF